MTGNQFIGELTHHRAETRAPPQPGAPKSDSKSRTDNKTHRIGANSVRRESNTTLRGNENMTRRPRQTELYLG